MSEKILQVAALKNGTVIDHIPADKLFKVFRILELENCTNLITVGNNLESKKVGLKGIIKISERFLVDDEANKISLIAPNAIINIIKDYKVAEKRPLSLPDDVKEIVQCPNPVCVTNHQPIKTWFHLIKEEKENRLKCHYCEREMKLDEAKIK